MPRAGRYVPAEQRIVAADHVDLAALLAGRDNGFLRSAFGQGEDGNPGPPGPGGVSALARPESSSETSKRSARSAVGQVEHDLLHAALGEIVGLEQHVSRASAAIGTRVASQRARWASVGWPRRTFGRWPTSSPASAAWDRPRRGTLRRSATPAAPPWRRRPRNKRRPPRPTRARYCADRRASAGNQAARQAARAAVRTAAGRLSAWTNSMTFSSSRRRDRLSRDQAATAVFGRRLLRFSQASVAASA